MHKSIVVRKLEALRISNGGLRVFDVQGIITERSQHLPLRHACHPLPHIHIHNAIVNVMSHLFCSHSPRIMSDNTANLENDGLANATRHVPRPT